MMLEEKEKIINALTIIKEVCNTAKSCSTCCLSDSEGNCKINKNDPCSWKIGETPTVWKAL